MKLLFDHNLSPRLVNRLADLYPDSNHLFNLKLDTAEDSVDSDFSELSLLRGFPPKVIWIRIGNCTINDIESLMRSQHLEIEKFYRESNLGILILS